MGRNGRKHKVQKRPLFPLGQVVATPGVLEALEEAGRTPDEFLERYITGDWGDLGESDWQQNDQALKKGLRLFSAYEVTESLTIWIITEWDRSVTTILLPSEY